MTSNESVTSGSERLTGRVKWFNNKSGFGFITATDGEKSGQDIFVHHSSISVDSEQYRYLVQGEYVEFSIVDTTNSTHSCQAGGVSGIKGGKLMCETSKDFRALKTNYKDESDVPQKLTRQDTSVNKIVAKRVPKARGEGPRETSEWTYVSKAKKNIGTLKQSGDIQK